jgi:REP element-mobilizing transposase RayT
LLETEVKRVRKASTASPTPELTERLRRLEDFHREWFAKFEDALHKAKSGPMWMKDEPVAGKVVENLHRLDGDAYRLDAYCVMSNHLHTVFTPSLSEAELKEIVDEEGHLTFKSEHPGLSRIMHSLKGRSARECNLVLNRTGQFWEHESFDHVVRPGKLMATIRYVLNNPVKAGLVKDWRDWRWSYCRSELLKEL